MSNALVHADPTQSYPPSMTQTEPNRTATTEIGHLASFGNIEGYGDTLRYTREERVYGEEKGVG